jgi:hypothetical protein
MLAIRAIHQQNNGMGLPGLIRGAEQLTTLMHMLRTRTDLLRRMLCLK